MEEIWKPIKDYEEYYQVSNLGRVKALKKRIFNGRRWRPYDEYILKQSFSGGYLVVNLYKMNQTKGKVLLVHRLVADHFIPNLGDNVCINHKNHIRKDNRVINLEWVTQRENCSHSKLKVGNKTGFQNVYKQNAKSESYGFSVIINRKRHYRSSYKTAKEAHEGYCQFLSDNNIQNKYATT
jgi:hypothetical protein